MSQLSRLSSIPVGFALVCAASPAEAQSHQNSGDLELSVAIVDGCTLSTTDVAFGLIVGVAGEIRASGTVDVQCTANLDFAISMDRGLHSQGINRRMRNSVNGGYMRYSLYSDPGYSRRWTDQRSGRVQGNSGSTGSVTYTVYGELTFNGAAVPGRYDDNVTVTIDF
ncbi:Csu type fimbrial protein [Qipengyuania qiaonensis]|uniref:Spore coat U domain-containing protein n=1 Tax=Qipengyuania qiaonensis TaxID=2867240 RepID=A0ABS7J8F9_9SPHN|nr:spore coat U domain-containing protein [Qipengyuania qiaonensis]MBX7482250.1 spore coat U domain-containing protein [Qipengyuania qiaonensis]